MATGEELGSLHYDLTLDQSKLESGLAEARSKVSDFSDKLSSAFSKSVDASKQFALGVAAAGAGAVAFGVSSVKAFQESQDLIAQTNAVLKSTGGIAGFTAENVDKLSKALQNQTTYSDEDVRSVENLLLTFTSIGKDIMPKATETVLDMATALGEDTKSASIQLGKALQDPVLGITALRRVGVNFSDDQKKVIQSLVDTGQKAKAQQVILKELNTEFGGSASAAADTFSGRMKQMKNAVNDVQEIIGGAITKAIQPFVLSISKFITNSGGAQGVIDKLTDAFKRLQPILPIIVGVIIGGLTPAILAAAGAMLTMFINLSPFLIAGGLLAALMPKIVAHFGGWKNILNDVHQILGKVGTVTHMLWDTITGGDPTLKKGEEGFAGFSRALISIREVVLYVAEAVKKFYQEAFKVLEPAVMSLFNALKDNLLPALMNLWKTLEPVLVPVLKVIAVLVGVTWIAAWWLTINVIKIAVDVLGWVINVLADILEWVGKSTMGVIHFFESTYRVIIATWHGIYTVAKVTFGAIETVVKKTFDVLKVIVKVALAIMFAPIAAAILIVLALINVLKKIGQIIWIEVGAPVTAAFKAIGDFITAVWHDIYAVFKFVFDQITIVIQNNINFWTGVFRVFWSAVTAVWNAIFAVFKQVFDTIWGWIQNYINLWVGIFRWVWGVIAGVWNGIAGAIGGAMQGAWNWVQGIWNQAYGFFAGIVGGIRNAFGGVVGAISEPFKAAFNAVARFWNGTVAQAHFNAPSWVPGIGGKGFGIPSIPYLAEGGIATGARMAVVGEAGAEAIMPLTKLNRYTTLFDRIESLAQHDDGWAQSRKGRQIMHRYGDMKINIGNINSQADADYLLSRLNRDHQLSRLGMSPQGAQG